MTAKDEAVVNRLKKSGVSHKNAVRAVETQPQEREPISVTDPVNRPHPKKGETVALSLLANMQRFFVPGVVGDFILEGWALRPGAFEAGSDTQLQRMPVVRQIVRRRTATQAEVVGKAEKRSLWTPEIKVTIIDDFALQQVETQVRSKSNTNSSLEATMAGKKAAKKAKTNGAGKRGRAGKYAPEMKIKVLVAENPKRGASAKRFDLYSKHKTVADFLKAGGTTTDLHYDVTKQFINVAA